MRTIHLPELVTTEGVVSHDVGPLLSTCNTNDLLLLLSFVAGHTPEALAAAVRFINPEPYTTKARSNDVPLLLH